MATDGRRTALALARLGFINEGAGDTLARLGWWRDGQPREDAEAALWALSRTPDPNLALRTLLRLVNAAGDGWPELDTALCQERGYAGDY